VTIEVTPIARSLGAIVSGVDLRDRMSDEDFALIYEALMQHLVLFFRDQDLDDDQHLAFASRFGAPNVYPTTRARGLELPIEFIEDTPDSPPKADLWHTPHCARRWRHAMAQPL
jgi:taurine dioxygenase